MAEAPFDQPRLAINRVYTRQGDQGETGLAGGQRVPKDGPRIEAYGTVDELNAFRRRRRAPRRPAKPARDRLAAILLRVQHELFNLGSILATLPEDVHPKQARVTDAEVAQLETEMDQHERGTAAAALVRAARRQPPECRAAHLPHGLPPRRTRLSWRSPAWRAVPPEAVRYLNRLSDALFVWSRWASHVTGAPETLWEPNQAASGSDW